MLSVQKKKYGMAVYCYRQAVESLCVCISFVIFEDLVEARVAHTLSLARFQGVLFKVCDKYVMTFTRS